MIDPDVIERIDRILEIMEKPETAQTDVATLTKMLRKLKSDLQIIKAAEEKYGIRR
ncbi:MAG: hypothetical protein ACXQTW_00300 [Candidatus Methanospirareceae archaeon]